MAAPCAELANPLSNMSNISHSGKMADSSKTDKSASSPSISLYDQSANNMSTEDARPQISMQAIAAAAVSVLIAVSFGWSGGKVANVSEFVIDQLDMSSTTWYLVVSIQAIGTIIGGLIGGPLGLRIGPYWLQYATDIAFIACSLIMSLAQQSWVMIVGRLINGVALGLAGACVPAYLFEIAPRHLSGLFGCLFQLFITFGFFVTYFFSMDFTLGTPDLWRWHWAMPGVIAALHAVLFYFCPGPVMFLLGQGKKEEAFKALQRLRRGDCTREFEELCDEIESSGSAQERASVMGALRELVSNPWLRFPLLMCMTIPVCVQFSGVGALLSYAGGLFASAGMENPKLGVTITGLVNFLFTIPALWLVESLGRKALFGGGLAVMCVGYILFCVGMVLNWGVVNIVFMLLSVAAFSVGPGPVAWMWINDLVPTSVRPATSAILSLMIGVSVFIVLMVSDPMFNALGNYALLPYAVACAIFAGYSLTLFPETKGLSYEETEAMIRTLPLARMLAGKAAAAGSASTTSAAKMDMSVA